MDHPTSSLSENFLIFNKHSYAGGLLRTLTGYRQDFHFSLKLFVGLFLAEYKLVTKIIIKHFEGELLDIWSP